MRTLRILTILLGALWVPVAQSLPADISPEEVRKAIADGVQFLKGAQQRDGSFGGFGGHGGAGISGLCTLALLNAGVPTDDPVIQKALSFLEKDHPGAKTASRTYATSLQTMVFAQADPVQFAPIISRNVGWLQEAQIQSGPFAGSWSYDTGADKGDNSNSQFALLALHEAERAGVQVSDRTWKLAQEYWQRIQRDDGSFPYRIDDPSPSRGSMTCAGIASLVITSGRVREGNARVQGEQILCCQKNESDADRIERALQWLGKNFAVAHNPGLPGENWKYYYLYCLERVGRQTARRFIGDHDWYREGTAVLLASKGALANYWQGKGGDEGDPRVATSMALLFLSKGRRPTLMAKLRHGSEEQWNAHQNDANNLTRYVESRWRMDLTWQVVDIRAASVEDLLQSPVLYYCGNENPMPGSETGVEELAQKLRGYVDRGGFLFAEAYTAGHEFDRGFRQLMTKVFPEPEYRLQLLPAEHPIWRTEEEVKPDRMRPIYGIDFGCRTSVVYCPPAEQGVFRPSLSCLWELSHAGRDMKYPESVTDQIQAGLSTGINILAYATNRELKPKEEQMSVHLQTKVDGDPSDRGRIRIANLRHPGGCEAAPRALFNLMETAANQLSIRPAVADEPISLTDDAIFGYPVVFMHGRNRFSLTEAERKQLKLYLERGGLLMANAICASEAFAASFRQEMEILFPDNPLEPIPPTHAIFTAERGGFDLTTVTRRDPQQREVGQRMEDVLRKVPPDLDGIRFGDRYGVIFSRFDLSCALEKQNSLECRGYVREDAARIGLNILLYSLYQ